MYKPICTIFLLVILSLLIMSFGKKEGNPTIETLIQEKIAAELVVYKSIKERKCREKILDHANLLVDSTLIARARMAKMADTLNRPTKPMKPVKPEIIIPKDTSPIAPLLEIE